MPCANDGGERLLLHQYRDIGRELVVIAPELPHGTVHVCEQVDGREPAGEDDARAQELDLAGENWGGRAHFRDGRGRAWGHGPIGGVCHPDAATRRGIEPVLLEDLVQELARGPDEGDALAARLLCRGLADDD